MLSGEMRQAGIIALEKLIDRLEENHTNAWLLAEDFKDSGLKWI